MAWFYNSVSGELTDTGSGIIGEIKGFPYHAGLGWHELRLAANASEAQAAAAAESQFPGGPAPTTSLTTGLANEPGGAVSAGARQTLSTAQFLGKLSSRNTLMRLAEGTIGVLLILVAVAKLASDSPIASVVGKAGLI